MRAWMFFLGVALLFVLAFAVSAQQSPAPPRTTAKADSDRLTEFLNGWERKSRESVDFRCKFDRITKDATFGGQTVEHGVASGVKPYTGRLDMFDDAGNFTQVFIFNGKSLYQYEFKTKQVIENVLPAPEAGGKSMPGPLAFVFGMTAAEARARFDMTIEREFSRELKGETVEYAQIHAVPKTESDRADFKVVTIVVERKTFLPRQIVIEEPEGNTQDWRFTAIESNVKPPITAGNPDFQPLKPPSDWKKKINRWGDPAGANEQPKSKSTLTMPPGKTKNEATKPVPPKR